MWNCTWNQLEDVDRFAAALLTAVDGRGVTIALNGDLGAGKTQLVRSLAAVARTDDEVSSPTFVLLQVYETPVQPMVHSDFYRLASEDELESVGLAEWFDSDAIVLIEWADKFPLYLPQDHLTINIESRPDDVRYVRVEATGPLSQSVLANMARSYPST